MDDLLLFLIGCIMTTMVAGAVGLLMWGAANEPKGELFPSSEPAESPDAKTLEPRGAERNGRGVPRDVQQVAG